MEKQVDEKNALKHPSNKRVGEMDSPILDQAIVNWTALPSFILLSVGVVWLLIRQRDLALHWLSGYPLWAGLLDGAFILVFAYSARALLSVASEAPRLDDWWSIARLIGSLVVYLGYSWAFARLVEALLRRRKQHVPDWRLPKLALISLYGAFSLLGVVSFLVTEGHAPSEFLVWTGASAAVLAFVMQQTLVDLFSGLALTLERPFKIGDWLRLEDGTEGQVQDVNWRATHLRKWDKTSLVIPNGKLAHQSFTNLQSSSNQYAPWYTVRISGEHDPEEVIELLKTAVKGCNIPLPAPSPVVRLMSADTTPYTYTIWLHFENYPSMFAGREELYREVDSVLRSKKIAIAADIHEVHYKDLNERQPASE